MAVTPAQIARWRLPSRPTKGTDSRSKAWTGGDSVELDAIEANTLRALCEGRIEALVPPGWLEAIRAAEVSERELLAHWSAALSRGAAA